MLKVRKRSCKCWGGGGEVDDGFVNGQNSIIRDVMLHR